MDLYMLGPLQVRRGRMDIVPKAAKPRLLLALLAAYSGNIVPFGTIFAELWGDSPPRTAATTLQTYVMQLRQQIAKSCSPADAGSATRNAEAKHVLRLEQTGYVLDREAGWSDVEEYDRLAAEGLAAFAENNFETARNSLDRANRLWRGCAYADVRTGSRLSVEATRLEESRRIAHERRIEADLRLGRHHDVLGELAGLSANQPANETLRRQYVLALYRSGHRVRALAECDLLRRRLAEEFGIDLSPGMSLLRQAILVDDVALNHSIFDLGAVRNRA